MNNPIPLSVTKSDFRILKLELDKVFSCLNCYNDVNDVFSIKVGIFNHVKNILKSLDVLLKVSELDSIQSLMTLHRMVVENYAVLYLFTSHSTKQEQLLRFYLFLLDAIKIRSSLLKNDASEMSDEIKMNDISVINADELSTSKIEKLISENKLNDLVNNNIISLYKWKFKNKENNACYTGCELYIGARIPDHDAKVLWHYYSSYVHGLGISLMLKDSTDKTPLISYSLTICSIIQSLIIKILIKEFSEETNLIQIDNLERSQRDDYYFPNFKREGKRGLVGRSRRLNSRGAPVDDRKKNWCSPGHRF